MLATHPQRQRTTLPPQTGNPARLPYPSRCYDEGGERLIEVYWDTPGLPLPDCIHVLLCGGQSLHIRSGWWDEATPPERLRWIRALCFGELREVGDPCWVKPLLGAIEPAHLEENARRLRRIPEWFWGRLCGFPGAVPC